jgi:prophage regulatory protein
MERTIQQLPAAGFLRLYQIIGSRKTNPPTPPIIPVGRTTWFEGVKQGRYPAPVKGLGKRITVWRVQDIVDLIATIDADHQRNGGRSNA